MRDMLSRMFVKGRLVTLMRDFCCPAKTWSGVGSCCRLALQRVLRFRPAKRRIALLRAFVVEPMLNLL